MIDWLLHIHSILHDYIADQIYGSVDDFTGGNLVYFIIIVVFLSFFSFEKEAFRHRRSLMWPFFWLVLLLCPFNPLFRYFVFKIPIDQYELLGSFWFVVPVFVMFAYSAAMMIPRIQKKFLKYLTVAGVCVVLVFAGASVTFNHMAIAADNVYKIKAGVPELADEVLRINEGEPTYVLVFQPDQGDDEWVVGGTMFQGLRMYSSKLAVAGYSFTPEEDLTTVSFVEAVLPARPEPIEYYLFPDDAGNVDSMELCGYKLVGNAGGYNIFR